MLARSRSRSTTATRAPPPRLERPRIAPHLPKTGGRERRTIDCRRRRAVAATEARLTGAPKTQAHVEEREQIGIVPKPLDAAQTAALVEQLKTPEDPPEFLLELLKERVPPGVDEAAYVKASFLAALVKGDVKSPLVDAKEAMRLLGTMQGGYNVAALVEGLELDGELAQIAADALKTTTLVFDAFHDVEQLAQAGNAKAREVMESWANAEWFTGREPLQEKITVTVFKVTGETNTDDLSPAPDAWSRPDIPLHALAMLKNPREGIDHEDVAGQIAGLKEQGFPLAYVGDVVGTGSSRKSATNSVLWYMGDDVGRGVPFIFAAAPSRLERPREEIAGDDAPARRHRRVRQRRAGRRRRRGERSTLRKHRSPASRTSAPAPSASAARSRPSFLIPWRTRARCLWKWTSRGWTWAML